MRSGLLALAAVTAGPLLVTACGSSATTSVAPATATRCQVSVTGSVSSFGANGGTGTLNVGAPRECAWTASSRATWIAITSAASGQGDGAVAYTVAANTDPVNRRGDLAVSDTTFQLTQTGAPCTVGLTGSVQDVGAGAASLTVDLGTHSACSWSASTNVPWAAVTPTGGKGSTSLRVDIAANTGPARSGAVIAIGERFEFRQAAVGTPTPTPGPAPAPSPPTPSPTPTPSPEPAPTPPPPPPPAPDKPVSFTGTVTAISGQCPNITLVVSGRTVVASGDTDFQKGSCSSLKVDTSVHVEGVEKATGIVNATVIAKQ